ncbi:elongation factor Tu, mitochondrial [Tanacetum coccineum]
MWRVLHKNEVIVNTKTRCVLSVGVVNKVLAPGMTRMENAELIMNIYGEASCDGSYIERKESVMVWHYKNAGEFEHEQAKDILEHLENCLKMFTCQGRGTVATGRAEQGTVQAISLCLIGLICMSNQFPKSLDNGEAGDNVGLPLRGISRTGIQIGQVKDLLWEAGKSVPGVVSKLYISKLKEHKNDLLKFYGECKKENDKKRLLDEYSQVLVVVADNVDIKPINYLTSYLLSSTNIMLLSFEP